MNTGSSVTEITESSSTSYCLEIRPNIRSDLRKVTRSKKSIKQDPDSTSSVSLNFHKNDKVDKNRFRLYKQRIEALTIIVNELQIQNERLNKELIQCQEKFSVDETPCLKAHIMKLTAEVATLKAK